MAPWQDGACATAPVSSAFYQVGVCQPSRTGNSSTRATAITTPGGVVIAQLLNFNGTKCTGKPMGAPEVLGNTTNVCQGSPGNG